MSSQRRDFRRMLYRLDLATPYQSIPALIQHFMDETALDGVVEVKMVASPPVSAPATNRGKRSTKPPPPPPPPLQATTSVISFRREGRDVNAVALYGPPSAPTSVVPDERGTFRSIEAVLAAHDRPGMVVKKRYPPRTTLVWVFAPLVQKLLDGGADTVLFEVRSYIAGADSVRESRSGPSPVSPYGTSHSTSGTSPSVLASGSTPSSGGVGSTPHDYSASPYATSPSYPIAETEPPILTELHRRSRELRAEAISYEAPRPMRLRSSVQRHVSMPIPFSPNTPSTPWSYPQPNPWTSSGYHDLQSLPPPPAWDPSFSSEGWGEHANPSWQTGPIPEPYAYPAIPPLPWQPAQYQQYPSGTFDPALGHQYLDSLTPQSFEETYYTPDTSFSGRGEFSASPQDVTESHASGVPATFQDPSGTTLGQIQEAANWQAQYPYLGALDIPPVDTFSYSPAPHSHSEGRETGVAEPLQTSSASPDSPPPPSSDRDSLTPTLTNPGYDRAPATTPGQNWPFVRGPPPQPAQSSSSAYTPQSHIIRTPKSSVFRSFSESISRPRIRIRSRSPEPTPDSPPRGAKRLKITASAWGSRNVPFTSRATSPPPLSAVSSSSQPRSIKPRALSTIASGSGAQSSLRTVSPTDQSPAQEVQETQENDSTLLEILTRPAPYKRMLGYAARQHDGSIAAYELSDSVAATTGDDMLLGLGLSSVTNVAALGMELGRRAAQRQSDRAGPSSQGITEPTSTSNANVYDQDGSSRQPRGSDGWRSHIRGASARPGWQGCVVAGYV